MTPFFSIIIPTYNRANPCLSAINSVIKQSFSDWELIIIDDGSTDNTNELVSNFIKNDERIIYIYQDNQERSAARNNGIENSNGKYICFLDSDDEYMEHHLETFHKEIVSINNSVGMFFSSLVIYNNGEDINHPIPILNKDDSIFDYLFKSGIYPCRVCIERSILNEFKFRLDSVIVEDTILWLEIASKFPIFQILEKTVNYYQHEENSVNKKFNPCKKMLKGFKNFKVNNLEVYTKISKELKNHLFSDLYYGIAVSHLINNNRFSVIYNLLISLVISNRVIPFRSIIYLPSDVSLKLVILPKQPIL